jgi:hypothetical protein
VERDAWAAFQGPIPPTIGGSRERSLCAAARSTDIPKTRMLTCSKTNMRSFSVTLGVSLACNL